MNKNGALLILIGLALHSYFCLCTGEEIWVSNEGRDDTLCGNYSKPCETLKYALLRSKDGDTITITKGVYEGEKNRDLTSNFDVTIRSQSSNPADTIVHLQGQGFAFSVLSLQQVTFSGISFLNGSGMLGSFFSLADRSSLTLSNCFVANSSSYSGAIYAQKNAKILIEDSNFEGIAPMATGGVIYAKLNSQVHLKNSNFSHCKSSGSGGVVHIQQQTQLFIEDCNFLNNFASNSGGAVSAESQSKVNVVNSNFRKNVCKYYGGSISITTSQVSVTGSYFEGNNAQANGGAIHLGYSSTGQLHNNVMEHNTAAERGGAVSTVGVVSIDTTNSLYESNLANLQGGGLDLSDAHGTLVSCTIRSNAAANGAGISLSHSSVAVTNCSFVNNDASNGDGGGIICSDSSLDLHMCQFTGNIDDNPEHNIFCSYSPPGTYCNLTGDANLGTKCDMPDYDSTSKPVLSIYGIIGIALFGIFFILFIIGLVVYCLWKRQYDEKKKQVWKRINSTIDAEDLELLEDYDESEDE